SCRNAADAEAARIRAAEEEELSQRAQRHSRPSSPPPQGSKLFDDNLFDKDPIPFEGDFFGSAKEYE
ncbi:hypothetical protein, partial [Escherichia coli]|uniref:hypothetical protein n=1 Tax=Escherichia coli TaxID=562 RepID=UPI0039E0E042